MNNYSPLRWVLPAAVTVCAWSAFGQTVNPANQIAWPQVTGTGAPSLSCTATNYGQPYTDTAASKNYTCGVGGWFVGGGGGTSSFTSNVGVGANNSSAYAPVNEVLYLTTSGNTAYACQEDHNKGIWDVRCRGWASNPSTALINTIQAAECYHFVNGGTVNPQVNLPAGSYSLGGNISLPPGLDLEGVQGTEYGTLTNLTTTDVTQAMMTQVASQTFTCGGTNYTATGAGATVGNIFFHGGGSANANDKGLADTASTIYIHNLSFQNFGGTARTGGGQNNRGDHIFFFGNTQWYYNSGAYNSGGFSDTNPHCSIALDDLDSHWDHIEGYGQLADTGYYNRFYLANVCMGGGQGSWLKDSFIQIAPHNIWYEDSSDGSELVTGNRLDDSWWSSIYIGEGANGLYADNVINGYCTSPTLNPANFPSNPGGVSTDPNCAGIAVSEGALGSVIRDNNIGQDTALWPAWPVWSIYVPGNVIGTIPTSIQQPGNAGIGPGVGGNPGNPGADAAASMYDITNVAPANVGGTIHFQFFKHMALSDTAATTYNNFDGLYPDAYISIYLTGNSTIINSSALATCTGSNLVGTGSGPTGGIWSWWWYQPSVGLIQQSCPAGSGGGGISGLTTGFFPIATSPTAIGNSVLDYNITNAGMVTSSKPVAVADGTGHGGGINGTEGTAPSGASGVDDLWADSTAHRYKMSNNSGSALLIPGIASAGTSGDNVALASNGIDLVDSGAPSSSFTPTRTIDSGAGTTGTVTFTSGFNDDSGWITITPGGTISASAGVVTITYGGTYSYIRKCSVDPANAAATALTGNAALYIPISTSTTTNFVINVGSTALTSGAAYQYLYRCSK